YGDGVNVAARLQSLADAGGVFIAGTVYEHVENKLALTYEYLGEQSVKNITKPVRVYRVIDSDATAPDQARGEKTAPRSTLALPLPDQPSIIVLPFVNMSNDPEQDYFSDGIKEDLTTDLSRI